MGERDRDRPKRHVQADEEKKKGDRCSGLRSNDGHEQHPVTWLGGPIVRLDESKGQQSTEDGRDDTCDERYLQD